MKHLLIFTLVLSISLTPFYPYAQNTKQVPPVDRMIVLMEKVKDGIRHVETVIIDFDDEPSNTSECRKLANDYEDFTSLDGVVICYYKGRRLAEYKI